MMAAEGALELDSMPRVPHAEDDTATTCGATRDEDETEDPRQPLVDAALRRSLTAPSAQNRSWLQRCLRHPMTPILLMGQVRCECVEVITTCLAAFSYPPRAPTPSNQTHAPVLHALSWLRQLLSFCICGTGVFSELLVREGVSIPTAQVQCNRIRAWRHVRVCVCVCVGGQMQEEKTRRDETET